MASKELQIPTGKPKGHILKELPEKIKLGIYRVNISYDVDFNNVFAYNKKNCYTNLSLDFVRKYQKKFNIKMELIQDDEQNAFIYDDYIRGYDLFGKWFETMYKLRKEFPNNKLQKHIFTSLWGTIIKMKKQTITGDDTEELEKYFADERYILHEQNKNSDNEYYEFVDKENMYEFNIRLKPFLTAMSRINIAEVILDGSNDQFFVRCCVDSACFTKEINFEKFAGLRKETKSSGNIIFHHCNNYHLSNKKDGCKFCKN